MSVNSTGNLNSQITTAREKIATKVLNLTNLDSAINPETTQNLLTMAQTLNFLETPGVGTRVHKIG